jgi:hypothetical protein
MPYPLSGISMAPHMASLLDGDTSTRYGRKELVPALSNIKATFAMWEKVPAGDAGYRRCSRFTDAMDAGVGASVRRHASASTVRHTVPLHPPSWLGWVSIQAELMTKSVAARITVPISDKLKAVKTRDQVELSTDGAGRMLWSPTPRGICGGQDPPRRVRLMTGVTLSECATVLKKATQLRFTP